MSNKLCLSVTTNLCLNFEGILLKPNTRTSYILYVTQTTVLILFGITIYHIVESLCVYPSF